jgi:transposase InsO family protein
MEGFFSSLKIERTANKIYRTRDEARADMFDRIERFYNTIRRHPPDLSSGRASFAARSACSR